MYVKDFISKLKIWEKKEREKEWKKCGINGEIRGKLDWNLLMFETPAGSI